MLGTLAAITLLNPHVYLDTVVLVGSIGARQEGGLKWVFVAGAASASLLWFLMLAFAGRQLQGVFAKPMAWRLLDGLTGAIMLTLSFWLWQGWNEKGAAKAAPCAADGAGGQNAGTIAPWYLSWMNFFTSGVCSAFTSLAIAGSLARSARAAIRLA